MVSPKGHRVHFLAISKLTKHSLVGCQIEALFMEKTTTATVFTADDFDFFCILAGSTVLCIIIFLNTSSVFFDHHVHQNGKLMLQLSSAQKDL